jgi:hypothetical protein
LPQLDTADSRSFCSSRWLWPHARCRRGEWRRWFRPLRDSKFCTGAAACTRPPHLHTSIQPSAFFRSPEARARDPYKLRRSQDSRRQLFRAEGPSLPHGSSSRYGSHPTGRDFRGCLIECFPKLPSYIPDCVLRTTPPAEPRQSSSVIYGAKEARCMMSIYASFSSNTSQEEIASGEGPQ